MTVCCVLLATAELWYGKVTIWNDTDILTDVNARFGLACLVRARVYAYGIWQDTCLFVVLDISVNWFCMPSTRLTSQL